MRPNIPALTSLRFFAAGLVVMAHLIKSDEFYRTWYGHILMDGGDAVVFFFALSGFIMTYVYHTDEFNPAINTFRFWKVRFARIYPAYLLGFIIALPNAAYMAFVSKLISASTFWLSYALSLTMMQGWVQHEEVANGAAWSLSVEIMFYALFPALLIFTGKLGKYSFALLAMTLLVLAHGIKQVTITPEMISNSGLTAEYLYKLPLNHLTTFVAGMAAGRIYVFGPRLPVATHNALFVCGSVLLVGFPVLADHSNPFGSFSRASSSTVVPASRSNCCDGRRWFSSAKPATPYTFCICRS
jgi:peptidoglycan/LPS O-acetylase OafA/YrhL